MHAVIMAGGKGTRLHSITKDEIPKPMAPVLGKPILQWQIEALRKNGIEKITIITGHLGEKIQGYFGDGSGQGVTISYIQETEPLGSAGALYYLMERDIGSDFLLLFGDVIFDVDILRMEAYHLQKQALATLFVHPNSHPFDSDLVIHDCNGKIVSFDSKNNQREYWYDNCVNAGFYILNKEICKNIKIPQKTDLEKDVLEPLVRQQKNVYAYVSPEYVKDVGTEKRIHEAEEALQSGLVFIRNLNNLQKCIFIDRDGTINQHKGLIYREQDFVFEDGSIEAITKINESGYLAIVITNQPVVARGLCNIAQVELIHKKMKTVLGQNGAFVDDVQFCPHHPDKGYPEENPDYKIKCGCRKPKTGMIDVCMDKYHIDRENSWFIGDSTVDVQTGINAGLKTALVLTGEAGKDGKYVAAQPDLVANNLLSAVMKIL